MGMFSQGQPPSTRSPSASENVRRQRQQQMLPGNRDDMDKVRPVFISLVIFCGLCCTVEGYPLGDFDTVEGLVGRSQVMAVSRRRRQLPSHRPPGCEYHGTVAITASGYVFCTGLYFQERVLVPTDTLDILKVSNQINELVVYGADGSAAAFIAPSALHARDVVTRYRDGVSMIKLSSGFTSTQCQSHEAIVYKHGVTQVDARTCKIASYGGSTSHIQKYKGYLKIDPLGSNVLEGCCSDVLRNIVYKWPNLGRPSASAVDSSFVCVKSRNGICYGDIGSPIFCKDAYLDQYVAVGMVDSGTCWREEYVGVIDFTNGTVPGFSQWT